VPGWARASGPPHPIARRRARPYRREASARAVREQGESSAGLLGLSQGPGVPGQAEGTEAGDCQAQGPDQGRAPVRQAQVGSGLPVGLRSYLSYTR
jgi:hypothetical protein